MAMGIIFVSDSKFQITVSKSFFTVARVSTHTHLTTEKRNQKKGYFEQTIIIINNLKLMMKKD